MCDEGGMCEKGGVCGVCDVEEGRVMTSLTVPADMYKVLAAEFIIFGGLKYN